MHSNGPHSQWAPFYTTCEFIIKGVEYTCQPGSRIPVGASQPMVWDTCLVNITAKQKR